MENFKTKLKIDNLIIAIAAFFLAVCSLLSLAGEQRWFPFPVPVTGDTHWHSMWRGFISGASCGILGVLIFFLVRNILALSDEERLKKLYVKEHDERSIKIWSLAREAAYRTFLILGMVAALISGYFSIAVAVTIIVCIFLASVLGGLFAIYYGIKY